MQYIVTVAMVAAMVLLGRQADARHRESMDRMMVQLHQQQIDTQAHTRELTANITKALTEAVVTVVQEGTRSIVGPFPGDGLDTSGGTGYGGGSGGRSPLMSVMPGTRDRPPVDDWDPTDEAIPDPRQDAVRVPPGFSMETLRLLGIGGSALPPTEQELDGV